MHISPVLNSLRASLISSGMLAGSDPTVDAAISQVLDSLGPALRVAAFDLAEQAACEVRAQLPEHTVDVILSEGDPTLRIIERTPTSTDTTPIEDLDARITLRLPPSLKELVERAADQTGESINAWVVDALGKRARSSRSVGQRYDQSFDL
jgi:HicB family